MLNTVHTFPHMHTHTHEHTHTCTHILGRRVQGFNWFLCFVLLAGAVDDPLARKREEIIRKLEQFLGQGIGGIEVGRVMANLFDYFCHSVFWMDVSYSFWNSISGFEKPKSVQPKQLRQMSCQPHTQDYLQVSKNSMILKVVSVSAFTDSIQFICILFYDVLLHQEHVGTMWRPNPWLIFSEQQCRDHLRNQLLHQRPLQMRNVGSISLWKDTVRKRRSCLGPAQHRQEHGLTLRRPLKRLMRSRNPRMRRGKSQS